MYRVKLISPVFGVDDAGPLHPGVSEARRAAHLMLALYQGRVRAEIHRVIDLRLKQSECVEVIGPWPQAGPPPA
ncbi:hypothetical protein EBB06_02480 [Crenobacter cavernae]|nr:hypothetical protein EBB06_02480 [Crenobacter cavernae]